VKPHGPRAMPYESTRYQKTHSSMPCKYQGFNF